MLQDVSHSVQELNTNVHILQAIVVSAIYNTTRFITVLNDLDDVRIAIEGLAHGQLSPILLPPHALAKTFHSIYHDIANRSLDFTLGRHVHGTSDYYHIHNFISARKGSKLLLAFRFPLLRTHHYHHFITPPNFTLYQLQSFPISIPGDNNAAHVTKITDLPYGIAFATLAPHSEYLLFEHKPELSGHFLYLPTRNHRLFVYFLNTTLVPVPFCRIDVISFVNFVTSTYTQKALLQPLCH